MANFAKRPQPYRLTWPLTSAQVEHIDEMFEILFKRITQVQTGIQQAETAATSAIALATGLIGDGDRDGNESGLLSQPGATGAQGLIGATGPTMLLPMDAPDEPSLIAMPGLKGDPGAAGSLIIAPFEETGGEGFDCSGPTPIAPAVYFPVMATVRNTVAQVLASGAYASITFDTEAINLGPFHSTAVNPSRFTVPTGGDGMYIFSATAAFAGPGGTQYDQRFFKNGTTVIGSIVNAPLNNGNWNIVTIVPLVAGDYVEFQMFQDSGVNMNVSVTGNNQVTGMRLA